MESKIEKTFERGEKVIIPVEAIEFVVEGNTIWVHNKEGGTTLRIKCMGKIKVDKCDTSPISHCDIIVEGDINFCLSKDAE